MEMNEESQIENITINRNQQLYESTEKTYNQKLFEEFIFILERLIAEHDLIVEGFLLKINLLERENVQLKSSQTDLGAQLCYLLKKIEINGDGDGDDFDFLPEDYTFDEFLSKKCVTFKNMEQLQEQNQNLLTLIREMSKYAQSQYVLDLERYVTDIADHEEKWRQHTILLQQAKNDVFETLKVENENLKKDNVTLDNLVKNALILLSTCYSNISENRLKVKELKKELLIFKTGCSKNYNQTSDALRLFINQFNIMLNEAKILAENNQKLMVKVKIHHENTSSHLEKIQSLEKRNNDLTEEIKIQQANTVGQLVRIESLEKENHTTTECKEDLSELLEIREAIIESYSDKIRSLEEHNQTTTQHNENLRKELKIREARIVKYSEKIKSLEKLKKTTTKQNEFIKIETPNMKNKLIIAENHIKNCNYQTEEPAHRDEISINAVDTNSNNVQELFDESPTQEKRLKTQCTSSNQENIFDLSIRHYCAGNNYVTLFITSNGSYAPFCSQAYPVSIIQPYFLQCPSNQFPTGVEASDPEPTETSDSTGRGCTTSYALRQKLKKKNFFE